LKIGPEPARAQGDVLAGFGVLAKQLRPRILLPLAGLAEAAGIFTVGIVGAGDEGAEAAAAQPQPALAAGRAEPGIAAVALVREQPGGEEIVERRGDLGGLLLHHLAGLRLEVAPEFLEHLLPAEAAAGNLVELVLQMGGEVERDVAFEEALEKGGQQPAALLG